MLQAVSKSDIVRLNDLGRFAGITSGTELGARILTLTDRIWRTNTAASRFITDSMVAAWLRDEALARTMPDLLSEDDQFRLLAWYCCARPRDSANLASSEPVDPILDRMAREIVTQSPYPRLPYTALMMSIYRFRSDLRDAVSLSGESDRSSFLGWYYCHGIEEMCLVHHVSDGERAALSEVAGGHGEESGFSSLCRLALEWFPHPDFDTASAAGRQAAVAWFARLASETALLRCLASGTSTSAEHDDAAAAANTVIPARFAGIPGSIADASTFRVEHRIAEYFDRRGAGVRLLLDAEWFGAEETFCWSRVPWASLAFQTPRMRGRSVVLGILLHGDEDTVPGLDRSLTVFLNGVVVWSGLLRNAVSGELLMQVPRQHLRSDGCNLLQFHIPEPFVPSENGVSIDGRRLGVPLRRFWLCDSAGDATAPELTVRPGLRHSRLHEEESERLLVIRGDLRSHTGYAKATRALAKLIPANYRLLGVDIHPDPADNQAGVPFPILPEAEALHQVIEYRQRCVVVHGTSPDEFAAWPNAANVGWFFWETEAIPYLRQWPFRLGLMDAIWAPTTFVEEFVRAAGYGGPVHAVAWAEDFAANTAETANAIETMAHLFDHALHRPRAFAVDQLRRRARLLFFGVQSLAPRKGLPLLLSEWRSHVGASGRDDVLLLRLAFRHSADLSGDWQTDFEDALTAAGFRPGEPARIAVIPSAVPEVELAALYRAADAYVSMSYGEGFGGPIIEALRGDCPVIAPRHTGLRDLLAQDYPLIVDSARLAITLKGNLPAYPPSAGWHIPTAGALRQKLELFAAMPPAARRSLLDAAKAHAMSVCWSPLVSQRLAAALGDLEQDERARLAMPLPVSAGERAGRYAAA